MYKVKSTYKLLGKRELSIISLLPIITSLIVIIGIVKLKLFYQNFSIPIKYYIGFSEIALTIAEDLLFLMLIFAVIKAIEWVFKDIMPDFTFFSSQGKSSLFFSLVMDCCEQNA